MRLYLVNGEAGKEFGGEDLLARELVNDLGHVELRVGLEQLSHLLAALRLANVVALLAELDLHVLGDAVDEQTWKK